MKKIALLFWGLNKSIHHTIKSIQENLFEIFRKNDYETKIFMHTYETCNLYSNKRSREKDCVIHLQDYKVLAPDYFEFDNLEYTKKKLKLQKYRSKGNPWSDKNFQSLDNFILANYSKMRVTDIFLNSPLPHEYSYIIYLRPDLLFLNEFPIDKLEKCVENVVLIPNFHLYGKYKMNDRLAVCNQSNFKIYGFTFKKLYKHSKKMLLHSETYLGYIFKRNKILVEYIDFFFNRVRGDARVAEDYVANKI